MSKNNLVLTGDENLPDMPFKESDVNHLRRLLAWMRCEYMLDEHMQRGYLQGLKESVEHGIVDKASAEERIANKAKEINNNVPAYIRQAHKMLSRAILEHDMKSGVVEE